MKRFFLILVVFVFLVFIPGEMQAQCSMCKQAAETSLKSDPSSMARSLNSGILYLMAVPYIMIAFIFRKQIYQLWKKFRNRSRAHEAH